LGRQIGSRHGDRCEGHGVRGRSGLVNGQAVVTLQPPEHTKEKPGPQSLALPYATQQPEPERTSPPLRRLANVYFPGRTYLQSNFTFAGPNSRSRHPSSANHLLASPAPRIIKPRNLLPPHHLRRPIDTSHSPFGPLPCYVPCPVCLLSACAA
jgi:hypothetical protein